MCWTQGGGACDSSAAHAPADPTSRSGRQGAGSMAANHSSMPHMVCSLASMDAKHAHQLDVRQLSNGQQCNVLPS